MMKDKYSDLFKIFCNNELQKKLLSRSEIISQKYENQQREREMEEERHRLLLEKQVKK